MQAVNYLSSGCEIGIARVSPLADFARTNTPVSIPEVEGIWPRPAVLQIDFCASEMQVQM